MTPLARSSPSLTATRSQGYTAATTDKTTDSQNLNDFVSIAMNTAGINTRPPYAVTQLRIPQSPLEDDIYL
ncbi:hypothetical protein DPMN_051139 [Dreissena polymorpha]|uniref:Uncharacterized protein n=1 Tax=Dreissena polymorpha TaxID=45954 RepID=A0A9D4HNQ7_DREPO|nr:hypothetical protein DPMN_051139 [Dreissena polymorpha]